MGARLSATTHPFHPSPTPVVGEREETSSDFVTITPPPPPPPPPLSRYHLKLSPIARRAASSGSSTDGCTCHLHTSEAWIVRPEMGGGFHVKAGALVQKREVSDHVDSPPGRFVVEYRAPGETPKIFSFETEATQETFYCRLIEASAAVDRTHRTRCRLL